jgi:hypothetical protein
VRKRRERRKRKRRKRRKRKRKRKKWMPRGSLSLMTTTRDVIRLTVEALAIGRREGEKRRREKEK